MKLASIASVTGLATALALTVSGEALAQGPHGHGPVHGFYGRDFRAFGPHDLVVWRGGVWRHEWHDGRFGWWWFVDGYWYFYPEPVYPYPTYVPPAVVVQESPPVPTGLPPQQSWYYCDNPRGYYPYVASCSVTWQEVPAKSSDGSGQADPAPAAPAPAAPPTAPLTTK